MTGEPVRGSPEFSLVDQSRESRSLTKAPSPLADGVMWGRVRRAPASLAV